MARRLAAAVALAWPRPAPRPRSPRRRRVEMTWMSIANWYFKIGDKRIMMDGYITRVPGRLFIASPVFPKDLYAYTKGPYGVDLASIAQGEERDARHRQARPAARRPQPTGTTAGTRRPGRA